MDGKRYGMSVCVFIRNPDGRYLFVKRSMKSGHFAGQWELPGGKMDPGEGFDEALLREVREETGLEVALEGVAGVTEFELPRIHVVVLAMKARLLSGTMRWSDEHEDGAWLTIDEAQQRDLRPSTRDLLTRPTFPV